MTEITVKKQSRTAHLAEHQFKPGESGNLDGRPKGSRNKLGEAFIQDVYAKWQERGSEVLTQMIEQEPGGFVRVVAGILPKELVVKDELSEVSDEELAALVAAARQALSHRGESGDDTRDARGKKSAKGVSPIQ